MGPWRSDVLLSSRALRVRTSQISPELSHTQIHDTIKFGTLVLTLYLLRALIKGPKNPFETCLMSALWSQIACLATLRRHITLVTILLSLTLKLPEGVFSGPCDTTFVSPPRDESNWTLLGTILSRQRSKTPTQPFFLLQQSLWGHSVAFVNQKTLKSHVLDRFPAPLEI
jgi:hypothetical protein